MQNIVVDLARRSAELHLGTDAGSHGLQRLPAEQREGVPNPHGMKAVGCAPQGGAHPSDALMVRKRTLPSFSVRVIPAKAGIHTVFNKADYAYISRSEPRRNLPRHSFGDGP